MALEVVGAGLGRTGTMSLQAALRELLGAPCYHMSEVFAHPDHIEQWRRAVRGEHVDLGAVLEGYAATVDWPAAAFWRRLAHDNPDAVVLLSHRPAEEWWRSADRTIFDYVRRPDPEGPGETDELGRAHRRLTCEMFERTFSPDYLSADAAMAAFEAHNAAVRAEVPAERLVEWQPGDGWEPICSALGLPVPDRAFPHTNTADEFRRMTGLS